MQPPDPS
jgi:spore coat protein A, manganese oxidase